MDLLSNNKHRNKKRITRIIKLIEKIWQDNPELRLMQLLSNCFYSTDLYYEEDKEVEKSLKEKYNVGK